MNFYHKKNYNLLTFFDPSQWRFIAIVVSYGVFTGVSRAWIYVSVPALHELGVKQV